MTVIEHPLWPILRPQLRTERWRVEVVQPAPHMEANCVACGKLVTAVRQRKGQSSFYLAVTCPLTDNVSCARSQQARAALAAVREAI